MLSVNSLRKEYNDVVAVNDISFSVEPGRIFGLLGPNGAGKSTTIRTILDIIKPTSGEILFNNKPRDDFFMNITGYLPEERGLYKKSKVHDIITYFGQLKGLSAGESTKNADYWLKKLDVSHYKNKRVEELSKGNQQKIQFIVSVLHNPQLLILDEPFSGFDPINQQMIKEVILNFVSEGKTIILSTHQMDLAEKLCKEIFLINQGKEIISGEINDVKQKFGSNSIRIKFSGSSNSFNSYDEIEKIDLYENYAEINLKKGVSTPEFLRKIVSHVDVYEFSTLEASLHKIFIDLVQKNVEESK